MKVCHRMSQDHLDHHSSYTRIYTFCLLWNPTTLPNHCKSPRWWINRQWCIWPSWAKPSFVGFFWAEISCKHRELIWRLTMLFLIPVFQSPHRAKWHNQFKCQLVFLQGLSDWFLLDRGDRVEPQQRHFPNVFFFYSREDHEWIYCSKQL